jgi:hypothetical protein
MPKKPPPGPPRIVRRPPGDRKRLDPQYEGIASGRDEWIRSGPRSPRLRDPRTIALIPGVANRDARAVFERRRDALRAAIESKDEAGLRRGLVDAVRLGIWRGGSLTGFDAFVENVLGLNPDEARKTAKSGVGEGEAPLDPLTEEGVAMWIRAEAALAEAEVDGRVEVVVKGRREELVVRVLVNHAGLALAAVGRKASVVEEELRPRRPRFPR